MERKRQLEGKFMIWKGNGKENVIGRKGKEIERKKKPKGKVRARKRER